MIWTHQKFASKTMREIDLFLFDFIFIVQWGVKVISPFYIGHGKFSIFQDKDKILLDPSCLFFVELRC